MRVNIYTEELLTIGDGPLPMCEVVTTEYTSSRTGEQMKNFGLRVYLKSHPDLHAIPGRDDDRSAVTFWVGADSSDIMKFINQLKMEANHGP